jgi:hypothetical protein
VAAVAGVAAHERPQVELAGDLVAIEVRPQALPSPVEARSDVRAQVRRSARRGIAAVGMRFLPYLQ